MAKQRLPGKGQRKAIRDRLRVLVLDAGGRDAFERHTRISRRTLEGWFQGERSAKVPSEAQIVRLAETVGVSPSWLLVGQGPRYLRELQPADSLAVQFRAHVCGALKAKGFLDVALEPEAELVSPPAPLLREVVSWIYNKAVERRGERDRANRALMGELLTDMMERDDLDAATMRGLERMRRMFERGDKQAALPEGFTGEKLMDAFQRLGLTIIRE